MKINPNPNCHEYFTSILSILALIPPSAHTILKMPTLAPIASADAQHGRPALPSALSISRRLRSRDSHETSSPHLCHSLTLSTIIPQTPMHIPFGLYLAITSEHHSHRSLHNGPPFLLSTFLIILSISFRIHCLVSRTTFHYLSLSVTISSYTASILVTPPYAHSFPFLSFYFPSHSYWLYRFIFILTITHLSSHWLDYSSSIVPSNPLVPTG
jgi:hypothetical protein